MRWRTIGTGLKITLVTCQFQLKGPLRSRGQRSAERQPFVMCFTTVKNAEEKRDRHAFSTLPSTSLGEGRTQTEQQMSSETKGSSHHSRVRMLPALPLGCAPSGAVIHVIHGELTKTETKRKPESSREGTAYMKLQMKEAAVVSDPEAKRNQNPLAGQEHCTNGADLIVGLSSFIYRELSWKYTCA